MCKNAADTVLWSKRNIELWGTMGLISNYRTETPKIPFHPGDLLTQWQCNIREIRVSGIIWKSCWHIYCAEGPEATLAKMNVHCCCCKLLFFSVGQMTEHYSELLFSNFVLPRTYVNIAWMSGSSPSSLLLPSLHLPRRLKCTCCGYFFTSGNFDFSFVSTSLA